MVYSEGNILLLFRGMAIFTQLFGSLANQLLYFINHDGG